MFVLAVVAVPELLFLPLLQLLQRGIPVPCSISKSFLYTQIDLRMLPSGAGTSPGGQCPLCAGQSMLQVPWPHVWDFVGVSA